MTEKFLPETRWCPYCNQGWIQKVTLGALNGCVYVCDECEVLWEQVSATNVTNMSFYLEKHNLTWDSAKIKWLGHEYLENIQPDG